MGRPVKQRESYWRDAEFLSRLRRAIEADERLADHPEWTAETMALIVRLAALLISSPIDKSPQDSSLETETAS